MHGHGTQSAIIAMVVGNTCMRDFIDINHLMTLFSSRMCCSMENADVLHMYIHFVQEIIIYVC